jgi:hypothetical protein
VCYSVTFDTDPDSSLFISGFENANKKIIFLLILNLSSNITCHWEGKTQIVEGIMVYLNFLLVEGRIRILQAQKHTDPQDPEH